MSSRCGAYVCMVCIPQEIKLYCYEFRLFKDIRLHFELLNFVRKSILYAKITISKKLFQN